MEIQMVETIAEVSRSLPPGFTFNPTDMQLLLHYLKPKILGQLPHRDYLDMLPKVEPKYLSSSRYNRTTKAGYWKPTGRGRPIKMDTGVQIGEKRILVYHKSHKSRMPQGEGTCWVIHEYHLNPKCLGDDHDEDEELRDVVCWIKNNKDKKLMTGPAPISVNEQGNNLNFCANQHNEAAAAAHPELGESTDSSQRQDGILSDHNTIPANQSQGGAEEGRLPFPDFLYDNDGNELYSRPLFSPAFHINFPRSPYL